MSVSEALWLLVTTGSWPGSGMELAQQVKAILSFLILSHNKP